MGLDRVASSWISVDLVQQSHLFPTNRVRLSQLDPRLVHSLLCKLQHTSNFYLAQMKFYTSVVLQTRVVLPLFCHLRHNGAGPQVTTFRVHSDLDISMKEIRIAPIMATQMQVCFMCSRMLGWI
jgi:hypothetical protein